MKTMNVYLDFPGVVYDNQTKKNDCWKADQAFKS